MTQTALIDTNILVYVYDRRDPIKQAKAVEVLGLLREAAAGYMSVKTLSEFFVAIRRIPDPLTTQEALREIERAAITWPILDLTPQIVIEAARGVRDYGFAYWDAQMWATAKVHGIDGLFSEDFNVGSVIGGVSLIDPLVSSFDLASWLKG